MESLGMGDRKQYKATVWVDHHEYSVWVDTHSPVDAAQCALNNPPPGVDSRDGLTIVRSYRDCPVCDGAGHVPTGEQWIMPERERSADG